MAEHTRSIRIQSDGHGPGTVITDANGKVIGGVLDVTVYVESESFNTATLTIAVPVIDIHAGVKDVNFICPFCAESTSHSCPPTTLGGS